MVLDLTMSVVPIVLRMTAILNLMLPSISFSGFSLLLQLKIKK